MVDVKKNIIEVVKTVKNIEIKDFESNIFCSDFNFTVNELAYILLLLKRNYNYRIDDLFIDYLEKNNSFNKIISFFERETNYSKNGIQLSVKMDD